MNVQLQEGERERTALNVEHDFFPLTQFDRLIICEHFNEDSEQCCAVRFK